MDVPVKNKSINLLEESVGNIFPIFGLGKDFYNRTPKALIIKDEVYKLDIHMYMYTHVYTHYLTIIIKIIYTHIYVCIYIHTDVCNVCIQIYDYIIIKIF